MDIAGTERNNAYSLVGDDAVCRMSAAGYVLQVRESRLGVQVSLLQLSVIAKILARGDGVEMHS